MSDENDHLPGVVFHKKSSEVLGTTKKGVKRVQVILEAEIRDEEIWKSVEEKLNGLKVYTVDDFKGEMLNALREDYLKLEIEKKRLEIENTGLREENQHMKAGLSVLQSQIEG